ncbi:MAG: glycosyltransferase [Candidatus Sumerlaeia bacterium]|nr:glycosyltransferase [Candidatus Sumerlaeia bacterium]
MRHTHGAEIKAALEQKGELRTLRTAEKAAIWKDTVVLLGPDWPVPGTVSPDPAGCVVVVVENHCIPDKDATVRHWLSRANLVACPDDGAWHELERLHGVPLGHKVSLLPPAVEHFDVEGLRQDARESLGIAADIPVVLFESDGTGAGWEAARFVEDVLAGELPHALFLMIGASPSPTERDNIRRKTTAETELRKCLFAAADMAVIPYQSRPHRSTARTTEYLLAGLPVLATREALHSSIADSGAVVTSRLDDFATDAAWLLGAEDERRTLSKGGRDVAGELSAPTSRYTDLLDSISLKEKRRLVILNDHRVTPAQQGGQVRVEAVCRALSREDIGVTLISVSNEERGSRRLIDRNFEEMTLPRGTKLQQLDRRLERLAGANASDVATLLGAARHLPGGREIIGRELRRADAALFVHPYMSGFLDLIPDGMPVHFDSLNTEWKLKKAIFPRKLGRIFLSRVVRRAEGRMLRRADSTYYVSSQNRDEMALLARNRGKESYICPNGVTVRGRKWLKPGERGAQRREYGLPEGPMAVFLGSGHPPNGEAAGFIIDTLAPAFPGMTFVLIGTVVGWFHGHNLPGNVLPWGPASTPVKNALLSVADIGLNPMKTGSGTSLKMMDYMASGLPILTTEIGARGMNGPELEGAIVARLEDFPAQLTSLLDNRGRRHDLARLARKTAETCFDWEITLGDMVSDIRSRIKS